MNIIKVFFADWIVAAGQPFLVIAAFERDTVCYIQYFTGLLDTEQEILTEKLRVTHSTLNLLSDEGSFAGFLKSDLTRRINDMFYHKFLRPLVGSQPYDQFYGIRNPLRFHESDRVALYEIKKQNPNTFMWILKNADCPNLKQYMTFIHSVEIEVGPAEWGL